ncbi:hypothetical protein PCNPT3_08525 [Psychromonas sp. CNPT3]|nr:hypothetical protein PCNPT3_08525 [Psychromonas sp. CNPT3]
MYKMTHRFLSLVIIFSMFLVGVLIIHEFELPLFVGFFIDIPLIFIPLILFLKIPFRCDQKGCKGVAKLEIHEELLDKWYRYFLMSGHRCNKCDHFIKLPRRKSSSY